MAADPVTNTATNEDAVRYHETRRVTWAGIGGNILLAAIKTLAGLAGHSQALVADGIHSLSDLVTDVVVLLAARQAACAADQDHPYGHARIETAATVLVGLLLLLTAFAIGDGAVTSLAAAERPAPPALLTLLIALISVAGKEALFRYTRRVGRTIGSRLLAANAWHHRTDALSSVLVALGIAGALAGVVVLDAVAALLVAAMIARVGWNVIRDSLRELVDTGLDTDALSELREAALSIDGVRHAHTFRSRWMGHRALVDLHIRVGARVSVSEGHRIAEAVRLRLLDRLSRLTDVMVHVDPEDDTDGGPSNQLPLRSELGRRLRARIEGLQAADRIEGMTLHYLAGRVELTVVLRPGGAGTDRSTADRVAAAEALRRTIASDPEIGDVAIHERIAPNECNGETQRPQTVQG